MFALSVLSLALAVVMVSHFDGAWHPWFITKSRICSFASASALLLGLLILLTQRHVRPDHHERQMSNSSPMVASDLEEPRRLFLVGNLILVALVGLISLVWLLTLTIVT